MMPLGKSQIIVAVMVALGWLGGEARATFYVQVTSTLVTPNPGAIVAGGSTVTLASATDTPTDVDLSTLASPVHATYGSTNVVSTTTQGSNSFSIAYNWTLTFQNYINSGTLQTPVYVAQGAPTVLSGVSGTVAGLVSGSGSTLNNTFDLNSALSQAVTTPVVVNGRTIFVKLDAYTPPSTPSDIKNDFSVSLLSQPVPEPTTVALMSVGGLILLSPYLRRKLTGSVSSGA